MSRLAAALFSSLALLSSSVSTANLSYLIVTTFSLRYLSTHSLVVFSFLNNASYPRPFVPLSSVVEALLALTFPFLSEHFFFVRAIVALAHA